MDIIIADDHILFRDTLCHYITRAQPLYKIKTAANVDEVRAILNENAAPDLCILDFKMPGMGGYHVFADLIEEFPECPFVIMSGMIEPQDVQKIIEAGAVGYLPKTLPGRTMLKAIDTMLSGENYIPRDEQGALMPSYTPYMQNSAEGHLDRQRQYGLTPRERDVLTLLSKGKSNREIAHDLMLQTVTVKLHLRGIFKKLECETRMKTVLKARAEGLVD